jgi:hypothetical protein
MDIPSSFPRKKRIDSGSIHSLICALGKRDGEAWTVWDLRAVAEVTLAFLSSDRIIVPRPPRSGQDLQHGPVGDVYRFLGPFVQQEEPNRQRKQAAEREVKVWIEENPREVAQAFSRFRDDPSFLPWAQWHIANEWEHHVRRLQSLIDPPFIDQVGMVLDWSKKDRKDALLAASNQAQVDAWSCLYRQKPGKLPPREIIHGFALSSLIRGRYYWTIARKHPEPVVLQAGRDFVVEQPLELRLFEKHMNEVYLAAIITAVAMHTKESDAAVRSWASNVRQVKNTVLQIPPESDPEQALRKAYELARKSGIEIPGSCSVDRHIAERWAGLIIGWAFAVALHPLGLVGSILHPPITAGSTGLLPRVVRGVQELALQPKVKDYGRRFLSITKSGQSGYVAPAFGPVRGLP